MIYILIPSYNDSRNFSKLLSNLNFSIASKKRIFIIDDGSTDNTKEVIKKLSEKFPVTRIGYSQNKGPGYAFKFGFNYLMPKLQNDDLVITMEADNTADCRILPKMVDKIKTADVVLASPYAKNGKFIGMSSTRKLLSFVANVLDKLIFRVENVKTYSSFNRIYKGAILKRVKEKYGDYFITEDGFSAVVELIIKLSKIGARFSEVPAVVDWSNKRGKSKMKIKKTITRHLIIYKNYISGKYNL